MVYIGELHICCFFKDFEGIVADVIWTNLTLFQRGCQHRGGFPLEQDFAGRSTTMNHRRIDATVVKLPRCKKQTKNAETVE